MNATRGTDWRIWAVASGAGLAIAVGGLLAVQGIVLRMPRELIDAMPKGEAARIGLARIDGDVANEVLSEDALMRDPAPLFLPSRWSASADVLPQEAWREPGTTFRSYEPKLMFPETNLSLTLQLEAGAPARAAEVFALERARRLFVGFGETGEAPPRVSERKAFVEVVGAANGQPLIAEPLLDASPPGDAPWQPMEFLLAIDTAGVIRPPVLVESSRVGTVDEYFRDYILNVLHLGERLAPGFYRVGIGP